MKIQIRNYIFLLVCLILVSCNWGGNYGVIKEYFEQTRSGVTTFVIKCDWDEQVDTVKIKEHIELFESKFIYSVGGLGSDVLIMVFTPDKITVTKDSCSHFSIVEYACYERNTVDVFTKPEFEKADGVYREYNSQDINGNDSMDFEMRNEYLYRIYFSFDNEDLVLHKDYSFKTERNWSYYFSKNKGLYKIVFIEGGKCEEIKIE
jgi:hypothetical protein